MIFKLRNKNFQPELFLTKSVNIVVKHSGLKILLNIFERKKFDLILYKCLKDVEIVRGHFGEFGVYQGSTFLKIISYSKVQRKVSYAFDSFLGMAKPTENDYAPNGHCHYPEGKLSSKGSKQLKILLKEKGYSEPDFKIIEGFIPESFESFDLNFRFSFAFVDLDQYLPTHHSLIFIWNRLSIHGHILCHDYFPGRTFLASKAIDEFIAKYQEKLIYKKLGAKCFLIIKILN